MRFVDPKSEVSAPMYCFEGYPLRYSNPGIDRPGNFVHPDYGQVMKFQVRGYKMSNVKNE